MHRIALAVSTFAVLTAVAWPIAEGLRAEPAVCSRMTPAKMLEHPGLAEEYAGALRSGASDEVARVEALLRGIREAHGCVGEVALPPAHVGAPRLPPGHPPIQGVPSEPGAPLPPRGLPFDAPGTYAI